jgi:diguanylate cyclase (GGDEF)-like protein
VKDIKDIVKNTLFRLKEKNLPATPDNYFQEFTAQAKLRNEEVDENKIFESIIDKLTLQEQLQVQTEGIDNFSKLSLFLLQRADNLKGFAFVLNEILAPSIQYDIESDIDKFSVQIAKEPKKLLERNTISQVREITKKRIQNDRKVLRDKTEDVTKLTTLMGKYFDKTLLESGNSSQEIATIKGELEGLNISEASNRELGVLQSRLIDTIYEIENSMEKNKQTLIQNQTQFVELQEAVENLQKELESVKEENDIDYLTKVMNRRAFDKEVEKIEKKHKMFGTSYAVVFYDIDHFKFINDTYGHDCGDAILRTFGGILKGLTRKEDVLARYGGEEFVVLLNYEKEKELEKYLKRVKNLMDSSQFNYKKYSDITVKFSAGLSFRDKYISFSETIKKADDLLYEAKNSGRNKIIMDNGIEI